MKLSICVPIYGTEKYIERCARSLFEQTYASIEYIFVNDCTKDHSVEILNKVLNDYPHRKGQTHIISHETNQGLAGSRLTGMFNSHGDYLWFVDSDDYVEKDAVAKCLQGMSDGYDMIIFNYYKENLECQIPYKEKEISVTNVLTNHVSPSIWKCVVRRDLLFKNEIYPIVGLNYSEDFLLLSKLVLVSNRIIQLNNSFLYHYELGNEQSYLHTPSVNSMENCIDVMLSVVSFFKKHGSLKKYHQALAIRFALCYFDLYKYDPNNSKCDVALSMIGRLDTFIYALIVLLGNVRAKYLIELYKKLFLKIRSI